MLPGIILTVLLYFLILPANALAAGLAVSKDLAEIRNHPDLGENGIFLQAPRYYPLRAIAQQDDFFKVEDYQSRIGWIHASNVDETPSIIVSNANANIRSGPGLEFAVLFKADEGVTFRVLSEQEEWMQVQHESEVTGWIHKSLVWGLP